MTATEQFIASLVHSLAWPSAVVALTIMFRGQLVKLADRPLRRFRAGPLELEFDRVLANVEMNVEVASPDAPETTGVTAELANLARQAPATAILEACSRVEHRLQTMLREESVQPSAVGVVAVARLARARELISAETLGAINGIAVLRNLAAHNQAGGVTVDQALEYLSLVDAILYTLSPGEGNA